MRAASLVNENGIQQGSGFWLRDGARLIQVGQSEPDGSLAAIRVFQLDAAAQLVSATAVARARYDNERWLLEDVRESRFMGESIALSATGQAVWPRLLDPRLAQLIN
jgi:lipopolysaccharide export system permease protein